MKKILVTMVMLVMAISLVGCGKSVKAEKELLEDLVANSEFYMAEDCTASGLTIIKRLTEQDNKKDTVYVEISIVHELASATQAYIMHYTCYNDGWRLDDIEEYHGEEVEWKVIPKSIPTKEEIMEMLIARSDEQIKERYDKGYVQEPFSYTYFFEPEKYNSKIYSGNLLSDTEYTCVVETTRNFEYMEVCQIQLLHFYFDSYNYEWWLIDDEIIWNDGTMYLDGTWKVLANGATIRMEQTGGEAGSHAYAEYNVVCGYKDKYFEFPFKIFYPTSQNIRTSIVKTEEYYWRSNFSIEVAPNMIWGYDYDKMVGLPVDPMQMKNTPSKLEETGIVDMYVGEEAESYRVVAKKFLQTAFIQNDMSKAKEIWHPGLECEELEAVKENLQSEEMQFISMTHVYTEIVNENDAEKYDEAGFSYLKENGVNAEEVAISKYLAKSWINGAEEYIVIWVFLVKEGNAYYVFGIDD